MLPKWDNTVKYYVLMNFLCCGHCRLQFYKTSANILLMKPMHLISSQGSSFSPESHGDKNPNRLRSHNIACKSSPFCVCDKWEEGPRRKVWGKFPGPAKSQIRKRLYCCLSC